MDGRTQSAVEMRGRIQKRSRGGKKKGRKKKRKKKKATHRFLGG